MRGGVVFVVEEEEGDEDSEESSSLGVAVEDMRNILFLIIGERKRVKKITCTNSDYTRIKCTYSDYT